MVHNQSNVDTIPIVTGVLERVTSRRAAGRLGRMKVPPGSRSCGEADGFQKVTSKGQEQGLTWLALMSGGWTGLAWATILHSEIKTTQHPELFEEVVVRMPIYSLRSSVISSSILYLVYLPYSHPSRSQFLTLIKLSLSSSPRPRSPFRTPAILKPQFFSTQEKLVTLVRSCRADFWICWMFPSRVREPRAFK